MRDERESSQAVPGGGGPVEAVLRWIERKRLQAPAAWFLEMHRALMPLAWSVAMVLGGVLAPLFGPDYYKKIEGLRDPAWLDRVLERLGSCGDDGREASPRSGRPGKRRGDDPCNTLTS